MVVRIADARMPASHSPRNRPFAERARCVLVKGGKLSGGRSRAAFPAVPETKVRIQTTSCVPAAPSENHFRQFTLVSYRLRILARTILLISGRLSCRQAHTSNTSTLYNADPSPNRSHLSLSQPK